MAEHGYFNSYPQFEYESHQQHQQYPSENERITKIENILNMFMHQSMINMQNTNQRLQNLSLQLEFMQAQFNSTQTVMDTKINNQSYHENNENFLGEIVKENIDESEENIVVDKGCDILDLEKELLQERSDTEVAKDVKNEEVMKLVEKKEWLLGKEESMEAKGKKVNKVEIDRVIDEICALFNKSKIGRTWTPHHLYLKFMEFLSKRRSKKDDVLSVSFWPP